MAKKSFSLHMITHFILGCVLLLKGFDKVGHHPFIGGIFLAFGIIILVYFFYVLLKGRESEKLALMVHWFEAIASLFTAYIFFEEGKTFLPYAFLLAAIGFFIAIYLHYRKKRR